MKGKRLLIISIVIVLLISLVPCNGNMLGDFLDKVVHFIIYCFLGTSILIAYKNETATRLLLLSILFGLTLEIIQHWIPGRDTSIYDATANTAGVITSYFIFTSKNQTLRQLMRTISQWS